MKPQTTSIRRKIMTVIMLVSVTGLLVTFAALMVYDWITFRQTMVQNLGTQARIIAENTTGDLAYQNPGDAERILASLRAEPHITTAALYDTQGKIFAKYPTQMPDADFPVRPEKEGHHFEKGRLTFFQPVIESGPVLGTLYLQSNLNALAQRLQLYAVISLLILLGSMFLIFWLSNSLQWRISKPIIALAQMAQKISIRQDYSLRAAKQSDDELGLLADSFNSMLERIQTSDSALRASETQIRLVTDHAPVLLAQVDQNYRYKFVNRPYAEYFGREPHKIIGKHAAEVVGLKLFEQARPFVDKALAGESVQYELEIPRAGLKSRWSHVEYTPEQDSTGKVVGLVAVHTDITERRQTEEISRRLAAIVESSNDAIIGKDLNSQIISWNMGAERLFGYRAEEIIGRSITLLIPPDRQQEEPTILERTRRGERLEHFETVRQCKDGRFIEISMTVSPIKDNLGGIIGASNISRDISMQKQAERELERAHLEAVAASRAKDDFLAALSHELRTPLNPVLLVAADAAGNMELPPEIRENFDMIRRNVEMEARLIDDLLDLTRITRGKLSIEKQPLDVCLILDDALAIVQADAEKKQIKMTRDFDNCPHLISGDAVRLRQIFWNILKNAVKFTPVGGNIRIEVRMVAHIEKITVQVTDTGIGLASGEINHIFDAFSQGDHAGSHRFGGLGLGLAISQKLAELHSAVIHAASPGRGHGATFTVEFPWIQVVQKSDVPAMADAPVTVAPQITRRRNLGNRILLVEDHDPTRMALAHLLSRRNYQVFPAACVAEAQALVRRENFDLVISDIGLPDGDGYTLMSELRRTFGLAGIALSGYGMEQDLARGKAAGFLAYIVKPVRIEALEKALSDIA